MPTIPHPCIPPQTSLPHAPARGFLDPSKLQIACPTEAFPCHLKAPIEVEARPGPEGTLASDLLQFPGERNALPPLPNAKIQEKRQPKDSLLSPVGLLVQNLNKTAPGADREELGKPPKASELGVRHCILSGLDPVGVAPHHRPFLIFLGERCS